MLKSLAGYRTYLIMAATFCVGGAVAVGWVTPAQSASVLAMLGALGGAALRAAIPAEAAK